MGKWLTPDTLPVNKVCRAIFIPDSIDWLAIVSGAMLNLTYPSQWEGHGILTPEECSLAMENMFDLFTFNLPQLVSTNPNIYRIIEI